MKHEHDFIDFKKDVLAYTSKRDDGVMNDRFYMIGDVKICPSPCGVRWFYPHDTRYVSVEVILESEVFPGRKKDRSKKL